MASGNVMKIPLSSIAEEKERPINISDEVNKSGVWRHIASESSFSKHIIPDRYRFCLVSLVDRGCVKGRRLKYNLNF